MQCSTPSYHSCRAVLRLHSCGCTVGINVCGSLVAVGASDEGAVQVNADTSMQIYREETFGPAMPVFKFKYDEEAIKLANDTEYGLAAYFFTKVSLLFSLLPLCSPDVAPPEASVQDCVCAGSCTAASHMLEAVCSLSVACAMPDSSVSAG